MPISQDLVISFKTKLVKSTQTRTIIQLNKLPRMGEHFMNCLSDREVFIYGLFNILEKKNKPRNPCKKAWVFLFQRCNTKRKRLWTKYFEISGSSEMRIIFLPSCKSFLAALPIIVVPTLPRKSYANQCYWQSLFLASSVLLPTGIYCHVMDCQENAKTPALICTAIFME